MEILQADLKLDLFFRDVARAKKRVLMLDYDGTIAPFRVERDKAIPYSGVREILQRLIFAERTRLIIISGRWTADLIPLLGLERLPELWGSHGWERLTPDGIYEIGTLDEKPLQGLAEADTWIEYEGLAAYAEHKPACLAVHWRGLEHAKIASIQKKVSETWSVLGQRKGLEVHGFDGGVELRIPGRDNGYAVESVLANAGHDTVAAYLGDDQTDEDAFRSIKERGLGVLVRQEFRNTEADLWIRPPEELIDFLSRWADASEQSQ